MTAIILAGGKSSRMGTDKAFLKIGNQPLIKRQIGLLRKLFKKIIIVTNTLPKYRGYKGIKIIPDIIPHRGPLGGIYSGLIASRSFYNFVVACDMPFLNIELLRHMLSRIKGYDVIVARYKGEIEPLSAIYSKDCIRPIKEQLDKNNLKIRDLFKKVKVKVIKESEVIKFDSQAFSFLNINTLDEYQKYKKLL